MARNHLKHYSCHLFVESFSDQMNPKNKVFSLCVQTYQKSEGSTYIEKSSENDQKEREIPYMEKSRNNDQK